MNFHTDMEGQKPHDTFGVHWRNVYGGIFEAAGQTIDPETPVRIEHHLHDRGVLEKTRDGRTERGAQHSRAAGSALGSDGLRVHA